MRPFKYYILFSCIFFIHFSCKEKAEEKSTLDYPYGGQKQFEFDEEQEADDGDYPDTSMLDDDRYGYNENED